VPVWSRIPTVGLEQARLVAAEDGSQPTVITLLRHAQLPLVHG
jgi:hypothetical protein